MPGLERVGLERVWPFTVCREGLDDRIRAVAVGLRGLLSSECSVAEVGIGVDCTGLTGERPQPKQGSYFSHLCRRIRDLLLAATGKTFDATILLRVISGSKYNAVGEIPRWCSPSRCETLNPKPHTLKPLVNLNPRP